MKRKKHEITVKTNILRSARKLFQEEGYQSTTIRKITTASNIQIGTLYHFFKDKEDIFFHIVSEILDRVVEKSNELALPGNPCLQLACEVSWHILSIFSNANTAELYNIAFSSQRISANVIEKRKARLRSLFVDSNPDFQELDYKLRALMIKGFFQSISLEPVPPESVEKTTFIARTVRIVLSMFPFPEKEIRQTMQRLEELNIPVIFDNHMAGLTS